MDSSSYYPGKDKLEDCQDEHPVQELSSEIDRLKAELKESQERAAQLNCRCNIITCQRDILEQRCETAEADLELKAASYDANVKGWIRDLRALRRALVLAMIPLEALNTSVDWELAEPIKQAINEAIDEARAVIGRSLAN